MRGQKIEREKGEKPAAATRQGSSVSRAMALKSGLWQQCCPRWLSLLLSLQQGGDGRVLCSFPPRLWNICICLCCSHTFYCHVDWLSQSVHGMCMLHTVEAYAKHAIAPGICTSRIFALAMCSWRVCKQNYGRVKKTSFFHVSDMHCAIPSPPPALLLYPRGKVARKIWLSVFIHRHREKKNLQGYCNLESTGLDS